MTIPDNGLQIKVAAYNAMLDVIYCEHATDEEKNVARFMTDALSQDVGVPGVCGCGHTFHLRTDCPMHGKYSPMAMLLPWEKKQIVLSSHVAETSDCFPEATVASIEGASVVLARFTDGQETTVLELEGAEMEALLEVYLPHIRAFNAAMQATPGRPPVESSSL